MANMIIRPAADGNLLIQDRAGSAVLSTAASGATAANLTLASTTTFPAGHIIQTVVAHKTDTTDINGSTATGWFDVGGLSASITPTSGNKILVHIQMVVGTTVQQQGILVKVLRSIGGAGYTEIDYRGNAQDTRSRVIAGFEESGQHQHDIQYQLWPINAQFLDSPSTASATIYKVQFMVQYAAYAFVNRTGNDGNNANIPRGASSITLQEIAQ